MKLKEMTLQQVLNGLKFEYRGINTVVIGNDDNKTLYIKNITKDEFNDIVSFDINNLKSRISEIIFHLKIYSRRKHRKIYNT